MPNTFLKASRIAPTALALLQREIVLPGLVWTDGLGDFRGAANDTVSIRVPARTTANRRALRGEGSARQIQMSSLTETKVDVTLDWDIYNAVPITDEELTLDIVDFGEQVLQPQMRAVAEDLENLVAETLQGATYPSGHDITFVDGSDDIYDVVVDARAALSKADVPVGQRFLVVGANVEAAILKTDLFRRVDQSGADSALREATIGRIAGFDVVTSNAIDPDEAYAFHRTAVVLATRAPVVPAGASDGQSVESEGFAMRWLRDYDFSQAQDRSLVDAFAGCSMVTDDGVVKRAVKIVRTTSGS